VLLELGPPELGGRPVPLALAEARLGKELVPALASCLGSGLLGILGPVLERSQALVLNQKALSQRALERRPLMRRVALRGSQGRHQHHCLKHQGLEI
jgi:hypothetical protein